MLRSIRGFWTTSRRCLSSLVELSGEVEKALSNNTPVVALESTIITHGMPFPNNLQTAQEVEQIIRSEGAVPATIAVIEGKVKVGLTPEQLEMISRPEVDVIKISKRDIPYVLSHKLSGGTTVSGTTFFAHQAGIKVFVTGGIGGVHRQGEATLDISSDLTELGKTPIMVVCSGVKSILDIGRTLEYLETQGVCVISYGTNKDFPSFFTSKSAFKAPYSVENPLEAAKLLHEAQEAYLDSGLLLAVPIPSQFSLNALEVEEKITEALREAEDMGINGKEITPFLLDKITLLTKGKSLESNIALIKNNARVGAQIAVHLHNLSGRTTSRTCSKYTKANTEDGRVTVIGGSVLDSTIHIETQLKMDGRTLAGKILQSAGGVGRNIADALGKITPTKPPLFISAIGSDQYGQFLLSSLKHLDTTGVAIRNNERTASYSGIFDENGECKFGVGDMDIHKTISPNLVTKNTKSLQRSSMVVIDGNIPEETINRTLEVCGQSKVPVWFEPTDISKATKPFKCDLWKNITFISPNVKELKEISKFIGISLNEEISPENLDVYRQHLVYLASPIVREMTSVMITMGSLGLMMVSRLGPEESVRKKPTGSKIYARHYLPCSVKELVNVSGAGDCTVAGFISGFLKGLTERDCVAIGQRAACSSLCSSSAVPSKLCLSPDIVVPSFIDVTVH